MPWSAVLRRVGVFYVNNNIKIKNNFTSCIREHGSSYHPKKKKFTLMVTEDETLTGILGHKTQETTECTAMWLTKYLITGINFNVMLTS